jgi:hypothetical protein
MTCKRLFGIPAEATLSFKADILGFNERLEIDPHIWRDIEGEVDTVWVSIDPTACANGTCHCQSFQVFVKGLDGKTVTFRIKACWGAEEIKQLIFGRDGIPVNQQRLIYNGKQLEEGIAVTNHPYNIYKESTIHLVLRLGGGKPVIYLFSPITVDAVVDLKLVPGWNFSALYPVVPIKIEDEHESCSRQNTSNVLTSQRVSWHVRVSPDGTLLDKDSGSAVSYLYWEALYVLSWRC